MNAMRAHASLMRGQGRVSAGDVATDASTAPAHSVTRCDGSKRSCCTSDAPELLRSMSEAKLVAVTLIQIYRYTLSAFVGRTCRHAPTCSEYTRDAIWQHGFWPGGWMGLARVVRCRPGGTHGYDPVPGADPEFDKTR